MLVFSRLRRDNRHMGAIVNPSNFRCGTARLGLAGSGYKPLPALEGG